MYLTDILRIGRAPNTVQNTNLAAALAMAKHFTGLGKIASIVVNTTVNWMALAALVPLSEIDPAPSDEELLNYHVMLNAPGRDVAHSVAIWEGTVTRWGLRLATSWILDGLDPDWATDKELADKVNALPGVQTLVVVEQPPPLQLPPAPAMPNFYLPVGADMLAAFPGDTSPAGTKFDAPDGSTWVKHVEESMFNSQKKGNARWERKIDPNTLMN